MDERTAPRDLQELAATLDVDPVEAADAAADGTLGLLIIEHLMVPEPGVYTREEVEARSGLGPDATRFWRALGFPDPDPDERAFTEADLEMLKVVDAMLRVELIERDAAFQFARVVGSSMQRVAQSQIDAIDARIDIDGAAAGGELAAQRSAMLMPTIPRVLEFTWRRHMQSAVRRRMVRDNMATESPHARCVGFADLVGFTALSQQLDDHDLAVVVDRFETTAFDVVSGHGGRVVKMIGDEVMFDVPEPTAAAEIALELADAFHQDDDVNDVRVGLAYGPTLAREGDLYGPTVNLASRIVGIAYVGAVVVSAEVRDALTGDERYAFKALRSRHLKHIGRVQLYALRRAGDTADTVADRARRRRAVLRQRMNELVERSVPGLTGTQEDESDEEE